MAFTMPHVNGSTLSGDLNQICIISTIACYDTIKIAAPPASIGSLHAQAACLGVEWPFAFTIVDTPGPLGHTER